MANIILSLKGALISTGVVSAAVILKLSLPFLSELIVSDVPSVYSIFVSYLRRPPFLYLLINGIIITIVASSKLQRKSEYVSHSQHPSPQLVPAMVIISGEKYSEAADSRMSAEAYTGSGYGKESVVEVDPTAVVRRSDSIELLNFTNEKVIDRPSVSKRFSQRKPVKSTTEGKSLGVSKPRKLDTLESTWKTITEGRSMPLTRHLKKSDTWERVQKDENAPPPPLPSKMMMKKSDTFHSGSDDEKKRSSVASQQGMMLKRDPSLSQDELNRRVEAFIKKFNEEMRLQRQESLNQYREMMSRGVQ